MQVGTQHGEIRAEPGGGFTPRYIPVTCDQRPRLSPTEWPTWMGGTLGDGIELLVSPCHLVSGTSAEPQSAGGPMGLGASCQSLKHPRSLAVGFAFNKPAEKIIYWQIKKILNKAASRQE